MSNMDSIRDALVDIVHELMENLSADDRSPCEFVQCGYYPTTGQHVTLFSALWTGEQAAFVQLRTTGIDFLEERLPKKRRFLPYTVLRRPPRNGSQEMVYIIPAADYVAIVTIDSVDDPTGLLPVEQEISTMADQLPLHGAN